MLSGGSFVFHLRLLELGRVLDSVYLTGLGLSPKPRLAPGRLGFPLPFMGRTNKYIELRGGTFAVSGDFSSLSH